MYLDKTNTIITSKTKANLGGLSRSRERGAGVAPTTEFALKFFALAPCAQRILGRICTSPHASFGQGLGAEPRLVADPRPGR